MQLAVAQSKGGPAAIAMQTAQATMSSAVAGASFKSNNTTGTSPFTPQQAYSIPQPGAQINPVASLIE